MSGGVHLVWDDTGSANPPPGELQEVELVGEMSSNLVIQGDNLPVLLALRASEAGRVQCVYIDPPYNTGSGRRDYPDAVSRADWLSFMRDRLVVLRELLAASGSLFIHLDDHELDYLKVVLDELFGEEQFVARITVSTRAPSSFSTVNPGVFKEAEYLLWYARDRAQLKEHPLRVRRAVDRAYTRWVDNRDDPPEQWRLGTVRDAWRRQRGSPWSAATEAQREAFVLEHARQVFRLAVISDVAAGRAIRELKARSREQRGRVLALPREEDVVFVLDGQQLVFYDRNVTLIDGQPAASRALTNIWTDIAWEGIAREGGVKLKRGKKPERLLRRVLELVTDPGDRVLDAFGGSGTTGAVAHKMGRSYILIECDERLHTLVVPRLRAVVEGRDPTGVSTLVKWRGGGGFRVMRWLDEAAARQP